MPGKLIGRIFQNVNLEKYVIGAIIIVAVILRVYDLGNNSLDLDEIGQVLYAKDNTWMGTILASAQHIGSTPLDYLVTHFVLKIGSSEELLRLPAVLWGVLTVLFVYLLAKEIGSWKAGLIAAFLTAVSPTLIIFSRYARFYNLATFASLFCTYWFIRALKNPKLLTLTIYGLSAVFMVYSSYYGLIALFLHTVWVFIRFFIEKQRKSWLVKYIGAVFIVVLLFAPWLYYDIFIMGSGEISPTARPYNSTFSIEAINMAGYVIKNFYLSTLNQVIVPTVLNPGGKLLYFTALIWVLYSGCLLYGLITFKKNRGMLSFIGLMPLAGWLLSMLTSFYAGYSFGIRHALIFFPYLLLSLSFGVEALTDILVRRIPSVFFGTFVPVALIFTFIAVMILGTWIRNEVYIVNKYDFRPYARFILQHAGPDDVIYTIDPRSTYYYLPEFYLRSVPWVDRDFKNVSSISEFMTNLGSKNRIVWALIIPDDNFPVWSDWIKEQSVLVVEDYSTPSNYLLAFSSQLTRAELIYQVYQTSFETDILKSINNNNYEHADELLDVYKNSQITPRYKRSMTLLNASRAYLNAGNKERALILVKQATMVDPDEGEVWINGGFIQSAAGDLVGATLSYQKGLLLSPNHFWGNYFLGQIFVASGKLGDAEKLVRVAADHAPSDINKADALEYLANVFFSDTKHTEGCKILNELKQFSSSEKINSLNEQFSCD